MPLRQSRLCYSLVPIHFALKFHAEKMQGLAVVPFIIPLIIACAPCKSSFHAVHRKV